MSGDPTSGKPRIPELDGLRGVAVALVLVWHYLPCQLPRDAGLLSSVLRRVLYLTGSGVDLFFALSGFLIFGILLDERKTPGCLRTFYIRRACRILPVYLLLLGSFAALSATDFLPQESRQWLFGNPLPLWSYATFTQNILMGMENTFGPGALSVTWSLAVEEQFYLIAPLVVLVAGRRGLVWLLPAMLVAGPVLRAMDPGFHTYVNTPWRADPLVAGGCVALIVRSEAAMAWVRSRRGLLLAAAACLAALVPLMILKPGILGVFDLSWLALLYALVVLMAASGTAAPLSSFLRQAWWISLGRYSYAIYMFHQLVSGLLHGLILKQEPLIRGWPGALTTLAALVTTLMLAWLSFRYLESPFLKIGQRFRYARSGNPA